MSIACSSTPVIGLGTFIPTARFAAPRSFYAYILIGIFGWTIEQDENMFTYHSVLFPNDTIVQVVDPRFWSWNSNAWTFDHIVCESYYHRLLTGAKDPAPYGVKIQNDVFTGLPAVQLWNTDGTAVITSRIGLESAPPGYWLPGV